MAAEGVVLQQFNEAAGGQQVFHLHFHVLPRWTGVAVRPPGGPFQNAEALRPHAERIIAGFRRALDGGRAPRGAEAMTHMHYFPLSLGLAGLFFAMLVAFVIPGDRSAS